MYFWNLVAPGGLIRSCKEDDNDGDDDVNTFKDLVAPG